MQTSIVKIKIQTGREAEFEAFARELVETVNAKEPGVIFYRAFRSDEPATYTFLEAFADADAAKAHTASEHFISRRPTLLGFFDGPPEVKRLGDL